MKLKIFKILILKSFLILISLYNIAECHLRNFYFAYFVIDKTLEITAFYLLISFSFARPTDSPNLAATGPWRMITGLAKTEEVGD